MDFMRSNTFCRFGVPKALINDQGSQFCNKTMSTLLERYGIVHRVATAYHPEIKQLLQKMVNPNKNDWIRLLEDTLTAYRMVLGMSPYRIAFGKECHLPVGIEHRAYWAIKKCNMAFDQAELEELRLEAYENSMIYKKKVKQFHDNMMLRKEFSVGKKVLLFNSRLKLIVDYQQDFQSQWALAEAVQEGPTMTQGDMESLSLIKPSYKLEASQNLVVLVNIGVYFLVQVETGEIELQLGLYRLTFSHTHPAKTDFAKPRPSPLGHSSETESYQPDEFLFMLTPSPTADSVSNSRFDFSWRLCKPTPSLPVEFIPAIRICPSSKVEGTLAVSSFHGDEHRRLILLVNSSLKATIVLESVLTRDRDCTHSRHGRVIMMESSSEEVSSYTCNSRRMMRQMAQMEEKLKGCLKPMKVDKESVNVKVEALSRAKVYMKVREAELRAQTAHLWSHRGHITTKGVSDHKGKKKQEREEPCKEKRQEVKPHKDKRQRREKDLTKPLIKTKDI
ncbi:hypothetical protein CR513_02707, partial [Mucuna pruriens]